MAESKELAAARVCMAEAEEAFGSADGLVRLTEGLGALADLIDLGGRDAQVASNLASSYAGRFYARVRERLEHDVQIPEPDLERYFKTALAFDQVGGALPAAAAELKIRVVEALVERYYEGHPPERKRAALEQLAALRPGR
jgi:hypothetical protein